MNLLYPTKAEPYPIWRSSLLQFPFPFLSHTLKKHRGTDLLGWQSRFIRVNLYCSCAAAADSSQSCTGRTGGRDTWRECEESVEVIVVGSRKDAVLDFCAASPILSPLLRFWNILGYDSEQLELQQRLMGQRETYQLDRTPRTVEDFSASESSCKAVILVASAAYGSDHITSLKILNNVKSGNGFVGGIVLKPFSFEGKRRQAEVENLVNELHKLANFCIVLDTNKLLENDMVTLDEALRASNNAVLMALNAISSLLSEKHMKILCTNNNSTRELQLTDLREVFEGYCEARIGFGASYTVKSSISQALRDCPFLGVDIKDLDGVILCIIASSGIVTYNDANNVLQALRSISKFDGEMVISIVEQPDLEPNTIVATVIVFGYTKQNAAPAPRNGFFSRHFPFIFNIFKKQHQQTDNSEKAFSSKSSYASEVNNLPAAGKMPNANFLDSDETSVFSGKIQPSIGNSEEEGNPLSFVDREVELSETADNPSTSAFNYEENHVFKRELLTRVNMAPDQLTEVSRYGNNFSESTVLADSINIYRLPVGVKDKEKSDDTPLTTNTKLGAAGRVDDNEKLQPYAVPSLSWSAVNADVNNNGNKANSTSSTKKQGVLSNRALSMLESERDSENKIYRVVEMKYRGGIYKGRAQGGLPEGKGRLVLGDGSIYDGMWRYGKRSGVGTFNFNNGDVYQGSWRDDVMHGKGWIYFHTGDRWFANFWKGKANGEGRFYSKLGYVLFGHFKDGWRHGLFLRINVNGTRCEELWDEGMLVSENHLDTPAPDG